MLNNMTTQQTNFSLTLGFIIGIVFCTAYMISSYFLRTKALENIKQKLEPDEHIVLEAKFRLFGDLAAAFPLGAFLGSFILPFMIFPDVQTIDTIDRQFFNLCVIAELFGLFFVLFICSWKIVYTNKRIIRGWGIKFFYKLKGIFYTDEFSYYKDVISFCYQSDIFSKSLYLKMKNNQSFRIGNYVNTKEIEEYVKQQLRNNNAKEVI